MTPVAIPTPYGACFGFYTPVPGASAAPAALLCPSLGAESHLMAAWRDLAARVRARGVATLRFDLPGFGESAGGPADPDRLAAWRSAISACHAWLGARHSGQVSLVGHRFGALLALDAIAGGLTVNGLALLDPPVSNGHFVRTIQAHARLLNYGVPPEGPEFLQAGSVLIAHSTLAELAMLRVPQEPGSCTCPSLLIGAAPAIAEQLQSAGSVVTVEPFAERGTVAHAEDSYPVVPEASLQRIAAFLAGPSSREDGTVPPVQPMLADIPLPGLPEQAIRFGPGGRLFGMLCGPESAPREAPAVLLPTTSWAPSSGHGRLWTDLARRLAEHGIASLRYDSTGIGASEGTFAADGLTEAYGPGRQAEILWALDALRARGFDRVVVVGFCSGAYAGWMAALEDPRIGGLFLGNSQFMGVPYGLTDGSEADRSSLVSGSSGNAGRAALRARLQSRAVGILQRSLSPRLSALLLRRHGAQDRLARRRLRQLVERGCIVHFVYSDGDAGYSRLRSAFGAAPWLPKRASLSLMRGPDHGFSAQAHRALLLDEACRFVLAMRGRETPAELPISPSLQLDLAA